MTESLLERARGGDTDAFERLVEPHRHELLVHCYRMTGTLPDAEDRLQDTLLRAWLALNRYEARASLRTWLYRIATNACLDLLKSAPRRRLVPLRPPLGESDSPPTAPDADTIWIDPLPDSWRAGVSADPEATISQRESISLAFITLIQALPPRQRAILLLCDVLNFKAQEAALFLDATLSAVNSALLRARRALKEAGEPLAPPLDADQQRLLDQYLTAWNARDIPGLLQLINHDAMVTMPPMPAWYQGRQGIQAFLRAVVFNESQRQWTTRAAQANGQPAFALYDGEGAAFGLVVLTLRSGGIQALDFFLQPGLFPAFGLPLTAGEPGE